MPFAAASFGSPRSLLVALFLSWLVGPPPLWGQELTYERDVRPILKTHCFHCHGEGERLEGGLDLRLRRLIAQGGESGPAIVAGDQASSLLWIRLHQGEMPPEEATLRPTEAELETIANWIAAGAACSQSEPADLDPDNYLTPEERAYWAFQPIAHPTPPSVAERARLRTPIDQFILAKLNAHGLTLSPDAAPETLVRRVYFDLLGLPPSPADVKTFLNDDSPDAFSRLVDRVLNSPRYGERWGRHWLDVAGYADSEGYTEDDAIRPYAYKYRDYVIRAFNEDKPFDEFVVEQLAGDELLPHPLKNLTPQQAEKLIATGFLRMAPDGTGAGGVDQTTARNDVMAKTVEIVSTSLLGLTIGCAQCHNHRYDPISHKDYHAFRAIFEPALDWKHWLAPGKRRVSLYTDEDRAVAKELEAESKRLLAERTKKQEEYIEATFQRELAKLDEALRESIAAARNTPEKERTSEQSELLRQHPSVLVTAGSLYLYDKKAADDLKKMADQAQAVLAKKPPEEFVRAVWESADQAPPKTFLFHRGDPEQPRQEVAPGELTILTASSASPVSGLPVNDPSLPTSGRRLAYAKWLTSGEHPLVARVIVNRIWLHHFGQALAPTPGDFGALGAKPTHPELLDWLATELIAHHWSVKHLHRLIMNSTVYRQASLHNDEADAKDAENLLYWRMPVRRLEAEILRDATLATTGELLLKAFGPAVPVMADRVGQFVIGQENLNAGRPGAELPMHGEDLRRSVYVEVRRSRPLSVLAPFDLPRMEPNCLARKASTVSPQSLVLMNSPFTLARAEYFAARLMREERDPRARIRLAFQLAFAAEPSDADLQDAQLFLAEQQTYFAAHPAPPEKNQTPLTPKDEAWASFCHALLSSNRFLYID